MKNPLILFMSMICMLMTANNTAHAVAIDVSSGASWSGWMDVREVDVGGFVGFSLSYESWPTADLPASWTGEVLTLSPNTSAYANSLGGTDEDRAYWTNSPDGGATAGPDGNKVMVAEFYLEDDSWFGQTVSFSGTISHFDLDTSRYTIYPFISYMDLDDPTLPVREFHSVTATGSFNLTRYVDRGVLGNYDVARIGFLIFGLNANPADDWGSASFTDLYAEAVPEPSTYALLAGLAAFVLIAIRRRK